MIKITSLLALIAHGLTWGGLFVTFASQDWPFIGYVIVSVLITEMIVIWEMGDES